MATLKDGWIAKFPDDLDINRYIEINFYKPNLLGTAVDQIEKSATSGITTILNNNTDNIVESLNNVAKEVSNTVRTSGSKVWQSLKEEANTRKITQRVDTSPAKKEIVGFFYLPLPNELQETLNHEWNEENGIVSTVIQKGMDTTLKNDLSIQKIINGIAGLTGTRNVTTNPDYIQMYKGTKPRSVSFSWTLVPQSKKEAEVIWTIIRRFKAYSSPHPSSSYGFLTAPYFCSIKLINEKMDEALKFNDMIIDSVSVNYSEAGNMELFHDGTPKSMVLSVSFIERRAKTFEDWSIAEEKNTSKQNIDNIRKEN
jgi:hypothetical protein